MPGFNQRGPMNEGPMTGRRMGRCTGAYSEEYTDTGWNAPGAGRGRGMGMGRRGGRQAPRWGMNMNMRSGMGWGGRSAAPPPEPTKQSLSARAQQLEAELASIKTQLKEMGEE